MKCLSWLLLAGCSILPEAPSRNDRHYTVDVGTFKPVPSPYSARVHLRSFEASEIYSYPIVSRPDPFRVEFLQDQRWAEPPAELAWGAVERILSSSRIFSGDGPEWVLKGRVRHFDLEGEFAHASISLELYDADGARIWGGVFEGRAPLEGHPGRAMSRALRDIGNQMIASLVSACRRKFSTTFLSPDFR